MRAHTQKKNLIYSTTSYDMMIQIREL